MIKKTICILFFIVLLLQSGGLLFLFSIEQSIAQLDMNDNLLNGNCNLKNLTLTKNEYNKYKLNKKELIIDGKMYDVKSLIISDEKINLIVVNDSKEEKILKKIKHFFALNSKSNKNISLKFLKLLSLNYVQHSNDLKATISTLCGSNIVYKLPKKYLSIACLDTLKPPPKLI